MSAACDIRYNSELIQVKKQENGHCVFNLFIFNYRGERKKNPHKPQSSLLFTLLAIWSSELRIKII